MGLGYRCGPSVCPPTTQLPGLNLGALMQGEAKRRVEDGPGVCSGECRGVCFGICFLHALPYVGILRFGALLELCCPLVVAGDDGEFG